MERDSGYNRRSCLGCLVVLVLVFACAGLTSLVLDVVCHQALTQRLPFYPGAEIVTERHNLFRRFGMGETFIELYAPDPSSEVREWYARTTAPRERELRRSGSTGYRLTNASWVVYRAEDGTGSQIFLLGTCAN